MEQGHLHLLTQANREVIKIFEEMGFAIVEGPQITTEWYNFDALNIPKNHPARDMQDTFRLKHDHNKLLRTQTSAIQVEYMEKNQPPFKIICPGKVFRRDASDPSHTVQFYQLEGLAVDLNISLADLTSILENFAKQYFGSNTKIRFRPGYFPFVEPGLEMDVSCSICQGRGCPTCKRKGWVELLGAGMVHPNVFKAAQYDSGKWQGYAFGMGIDRLAMMKYQINDIRTLYENDLRFLKQF